MHWSFHAAAATVVAVSLAIVAACCAQDFGVRSMKPNFPEQKKPKIDEKAYKAALDKIPPPIAKYDPWRDARGEKEKPDKK